MDESWKEVHSLKPNCCRRDQRGRSRSSSIRGKKLADRVLRFERRFALRHRHAARLSGLSSAWDGPERSVLISSPLRAP
jgi:hypothetical protein